MITLLVPRIFRETKGVRFHDISVHGSNGLDLVEHAGQSVSPPNKHGAKQWYVHRHQIDNNRVIKGRRLFELYFAQWKDPHWFVMLDEESGALEIPAGCFHRSHSGHEGSLLLNHAVRDPEYDERHEFNPTVIYGHLLHAPQYHGCTAAQVEQFIKTGTFD